MDVDAILGMVSSPQREARQREEPIPLEGATPKHVAHRRRRVFHDESRTSNARKTIAALPARGESHHYVMSGSYDAFDLVDVVLELAGPVQALHLASLGFNAANATRLLAMLDAGRAQRAHLLVSVYYEADRKEAETCYRLANELPARGGGWYCAARSHAKVFVADEYVIEASANLRSCRMIEQFTLTNCPELAGFHRDWMERVNRETKERRAGK